MSHELFTYRCPQCKAVTITTLVMAQPPLRCPACHWSMAYLYATPVSAEEWHARNLTPPVFRPAQPIANVAPEDREKRCSRFGCREYRRKRDLLAGRFCSEACGAQDSLDREAALRRTEQRYQEMPWLRPAVKEVTHG